MTMGTTNSEAANTNIKSVVEEGFYFTDNNNNIAIGIANNYIQMGLDFGSCNFLSGSSGWRIQPDGTAEFQNLKVDGNLDVYVLTYNEMRATNGILLVTDCGCIEDATTAVISNVTYWIFTINEFPPFAINDYVMLQYRPEETRIFQFKGIVTAINADGKNTVRVKPLSGFAGNGTSVDERGVTTFRTVDPDTAEGEYLIRIGNKTDPNRQTIIKLNPYDGGYIDFMTGLNSSTRLASENSISGTLPTATRIGNLTGVTYKGTSLQGYGLFSDNAYLSGAIRNLQNKWSLNADGSGQVAANHISWDASGNLTIKIGNTNLVDYVGNLNQTAINNLNSSINSISQSITNTIKALENNLNSSINSTAQEIIDDFLNQIYDVSTAIGGDINIKYQKLDASIKATAESLTSDYSARITNISTRLKDVSARVKDVSSRLKQTAESLTSDYSAKIYDISTDLNGNISATDSTLRGLITQTAESLTSDYSAKIYNVSTYAKNVSTRLKDVSSRLKQTAESLTSDFYATIYDVSTYAKNTSTRLRNVSTYAVDVSSRLKQTAQSFETRVSAIEGDYVTSTEISQLTDSISLNVYNGISGDLLDKTGIDIQSGHITIDAYNTTFNGNIILSNADEGIIIKDSNGNPRINIQNNSLGNLSSFDFGLNNNCIFKGSKNYSSARTSVSIDFSAQTIGTLSSGQKLMLNNMGFDGYWQNLLWPETVINSATYSYTIKCGSTTVTTQSGSATKDTTKNYEWRIPNYTISSVGYSGTYTVSLSVTLNMSSNSNYKGYFHFFGLINAHAPATSVNRIAIDGAVFASDTDKYNWFGSDLTQIRNGASAIRAYNGKLQRNSVNTNTTTFSDKWSDLSSTVPYRIVNTATYTATTDDCLIYFSTVIGNNDAQRVLYLPHPSTCPGKFYFVKNGTINNTIAYVSGHTTEYLFVWQSETSK